MEKEIEGRKGEEEIKEEEDEEESKTSREQHSPNPIISPKSRSVKTKVPEVEIHLYRKGKGPIEVFKATLSGWDQDQLDVLQILEKHGFKSIFAFNPGQGRGVLIRFNPKNGRSLLPYADGSVIYIDGEPKDSLLNPISKILLGVAVLTILITLLLKETPEWIKTSKFGGMFPPWVLACMVIVFTRLRKRTRDLLKKYGW